MGGEGSHRGPLALVLAALLIVTPAIALRADQDKKPAVSPDKFNGAYLMKLTLDLRDTVSAPIHWQSGDLIALGIFAGATAILYAKDQALTDWIRKLTTPAIPDAFIAKVGNGIYLTGFSAALYLTGEAFRSPSIRRTALVGFESFVTASALVLTLKVIIGRARPAAREGTDRFHPFAFRNVYASFPSGDAAGAFALATFIAKQSRSILGDILAYGVAGLVALNRVHDGKHWPSDMFAGAAIGYFVGDKLFAINHGQAQPSVKLAVAPSFRYPGVSVILTF
jgi:membrane-associated phospholipid phosphatase